MTLYDRIKSKRLGDLLVDEDLATEEIVIAALHEQQATGLLLSEILMESRTITEWDLARVVVREYQVPYIELASYTLHKDLVETFSPVLLNRARVVPLDRFGSIVCFACQEIPMADVVAELAEKAKGGVYLYISSARDIRQALHEHAAVSESVEQTEDVDVKSAANQGAPVASGSMDQDANWQNLFDAADESVQSDD